MKMLIFISLVFLGGCAPSAATRQGAHDLAHELPGIFQRHDPAEEAAACRLATAIDVALNGATTTAN